ncbi:MAG: ORF6N domain-containing protein [Oscillospiraceae bacterium]|nr:ORF6N domain-containing protein [Oscillospiraceae bacterium]
MNGLTPIEYNNQRILTTRQLAEGYESDPKRKNF